MRGHPRHPQVVEDVHLAEESLMSGEMREQLVLVVEAPASGVEGGLVERCEGDAIDAFIEGEIDHAGKRLAADATRIRRHCAARHRGRDRDCEGR